MVDEDDVYGNFRTFGGKVDDYSQKDIEDIKVIMYEEATKILENHDINISDHDVEWSVQQHNVDGPIFISDPKNGIDGPYITIAWKVTVKNDG